MGVALGAVTGLFLAAMLGLVGGVLVIFNSFEGDDPSAFRWMEVPLELGLLVGAFVGGAIGFRRARRRARHTEVAAGTPPRPDLSS